MSAIPAIKEIGNLRPGDHLCCIYQTDDEHRAVLIPYLRYGLERHEKVFYIVDARTADDILAQLRASGTDPAPYLASGQLAVLTIDQAYMKTGVFDPDGMIRLLTTETEKALVEGYAALRVTGEMSWALREFPGAERLIEYEAKLNTFFPTHKCMAICQYDRRRFDAKILLNVLSTHPLAIVGTEIYDNFYYMPPDEFMSADLPSATLEHWIAHLRRHREMQIAAADRERLLRDMGSMAKVGGWEVDVATRRVTWTEEVYRIHGLPLSHKPTLEAAISYFAPDSIPVLTEAIERAIEAGTPYDLELELVTSAGKRIWTHSIGRAVRSDGRTVKLQGIFQDIDDRKRALTALRESELKYRELFESSADAIMMLTPEEGFFDANRATLALFGCADKEQFTSMGPADLSPPTQPDGTPSTEKAAAMMKKAMESGINFFDWTHRKVDGTAFPATVLLTRTTIGGRKVLQATVRDVSATKKLESELMKRLADLEKFNKFAVGRELRMMELKNRIKELEERLEKR